MEAGGGDFPVALTINPWDRGPPVGLNHRGGLRAGSDTTKGAQPWQRRKEVSRI